MRSERFRTAAARVLLDVGLVLGGALALAAVAVIVGLDGGLAYDTRAYLLAARHVLDGTPLYTQASVSDLGAFKYPPIFAQLFVPFAPLPELAVAWAWRISGILCLRYMVGSWKAALVACAFLPVLIELSLGNVTLQIGAMLVFALRDRRGAYLLPWAAALKFGPVLLVPYLWFRKPESRRPLVIGTAVFAAICGASYLVAPGEWSGYATTFGWENNSVMSGSGVIAIVPSWGGLDFVLRFAIAAAVALYATYTRREWLAYAAAVITCPILAFSRFAPWVALWRFRRPADRGPLTDSSGAPRPAAAAEPAAA
ncbi:MAG: glycosyltransferase family 87 protein [Candidatus Limnocylindrales bacterium]